MSDFGMKPEGFLLKRREDIKRALEASARLALGADAVLAPDSVEGQMIAALTQEYTDLWEETQNAYDAFNPNTAAGRTLEHICLLNGVIRQNDERSFVTVNLTGTDGTTIPIESVVGTVDTGVRFYTDEEVTIAGGVATVTATALDPGPQGASAGSVVRIFTPLSGWDTVTNPEDATPGRNRETDEALRTRREKSLSLAGVSTIEALYSIISNVEGVSHARVYENNTDVTDSRTLPPHSFCCVVRGGLDEDIGVGIWSRKPSGILSYGNTTVAITDIQGELHSLDFMRPADVDIWVRVTLNVLTTDFPTDADELIKDAIISYAEGSLVAGAGFDVADDIINSRMYTPVNLAVQGHTVVSLEMSTDGTTFNAQDIPINIFEIGLFTPDNIEVIIS